MDFADKVKACMYLESQNPNMGLGEIRQFVQACINLGAKQHIEQCRRSNVPPCDVSGVPMERGDG